MIRELISQLRLTCGSRVWLTGAQNDRATMHNGTRCRCRFTFKSGVFAPRSGNVAATSAARVVYDRTIPERYRLERTSVDAIGGVPFNELVYFQNRFGAQGVGSLPFAVRLENDGATFYGWELVDELDGKTFQAITDAVYAAPPRGERSASDDSSAWIVPTIETITWRRVA